MGCTLAAIIGHFIIGTICAATVSNLIGFSFAACMFFSAMAGHLQVQRINCNINKLSKLLQQTESPVIGQSDCFNLLVAQLIISEITRRDDHVHNRQIWIYCGNAMTAVAVVGMLLVINVATFSIPMVGMAIASGVAAAVGVYPT